MRRRVVFIPFSRSVREGREQFNVILGTKTFFFLNLLSWRFSLSLLSLTVNQLLAPLLHVLLHNRFPSHRISPTRLRSLANCIQPCCQLLSGRCRLPLVLVAGDTPPSYFVDLLCVLIRCGDHKTSRTVKATFVVRWVEKEPTYPVAPPRDTASTHFSTSTDIRQCLGLKSPI